MGSGMTAIADSDSSAAGEGLARIPAMFEEWENVLSRFRPESELSNLNRQSGSDVVVGPVLWRVLCEALSAAHLTDGLVTPTMLTALENAGYRESFEMLKGNSSVAVLPQRNAGVIVQDDWRSIRVNGNTHTVTV